MSTLNRSFSSINFVQDIFVGENLMSGSVLAKGSSFLSCSFLSFLSLSISPSLFLSNFHA